MKIQCYRVRLNRDGYDRMGSSASRRQSVMTVKKFACALATGLIFALASSLTGIPFWATAPVAFWSGMCIGYFVEG